MTRQLFPATGVFIGLLAAAPGLLAAGQCGNQDFKGLYGVLGSGAATAFPPPLMAFVGPFGRAGQAIADGQGNISFNTTASYNGFVFSEPFSGTYEVGPDCRVSMTLIVSPPGAPQIHFPVTFAGVISDNKREVTSVFTSPPGGAVRIKLRRQDRANCSDRDLSDAFRLELSGTIVSQGQNPPGVFNRVGKVQFDGQGGFAAATWANYNGSAVEENFFGSYSVDSSCTLTMNYTFLGQSYTWVGALTDNSSAADLIVSSPMGAAVVGTLQEL